MITSDVTVYGKRPTCTEQVLGTDGKPLLRQPIPQSSDLCVIDPNGKPAFRVHVRSLSYPQPKPLAQ